MARPPNHLWRRRRGDWARGGVGRYASEAGTFRFVVFKNLGGRAP